MYLNLKKDTTQCHWVIKNLESVNYWWGNEDG